MDDYTIEPLVFLAANGHLRDDEISAIRADADEARPRIGTGYEQWGSGGMDMLDQLKVKAWEAVKAALGDSGTH